MLFKKKEKPVQPEEQSLKNQPNVKDAFIKELDEMENRYIKIKPEEWPQDIHKYILDLEKKPSISEREGFIITTRLFRLKEWFVVPYPDSKQPLAYHGKFNNDLVLYAFTSREVAREFGIQKGLLKNDAPPNTILPIPTEQIVFGICPFVSPIIGYIRFDDLWMVNFKSIEESYFSSIKSYRLHSMIKAKFSGTDKSQEMFNEMTKLQVWYMLADSTLLFFMPHMEVFTKIPIFSSRIIAQTFKDQINRPDLKIVKMITSEALEMIYHNRLAGTFGFHFINYDPIIRNSVEFFIDMKYLEEKISELHQMNTQGEMFTRFGTEESITRADWIMMVNFAKKLPNREANGLVFGNLFLLKDWHFIWRSDNFESGKGHVYNVIHEGIPTLCVFTSTELALEYAKTIPNIGDKIVLGTYKIPGSIPEIIKLSQIGIKNILFNSHVEESGGYQGPILSLQVGYEWHQQNDPRFKSMTVKSESA